MGEDESIPGYYAAVAEDRYGGVVPLRQRPLQEFYPNEWEKTPQYSARRPSNSSSEEEEVKRVPAQRKRPLVEYCTNEWKRTKEQYLPSTRSLPLYSDEEEDWFDRVDDFLEHVLSIFHSSRFRQIGVRLLLAFFSLLLLWFQLIGPIVERHWLLTEALSTKVSIAAGGHFGSNLTPEFPGMVYIEKLDPALLPGGMGGPDPKPKNGRRLIFVGDIHGCKHELKALLQKVHFDKSNDHLITTGDVVNKGPDSAGVVDVLRDVDATSVRGNHDDRVILEAESVSSSRMRKGASNIGSGHASNVTSETNSARPLSETLTHKQLEYLRASPVMLQVGYIKSMGEVVVTHAGLVPGLPLRKQDPVSVMNMRIIDLATFVPSKDHERKGSIPWAELWNKQQELMPMKKWWWFGTDGIDNHTTVVYGHDSKKGLQLHKYTKGLDSGCYKGGQLTALVVGDGGSQHIVQVDGKDYRQPS